MTKTKSMLSMIAFAAFVMFVSSCKKEDEKPVYVFTYNGKTTSIKAVLFNYDESPSNGQNPGEKIYKNSLTLLSDGLIVENGDVTSGKGDEIFLFITSASPELEVGIYTFSEKPYQAPFQILFANVVQNIDIAAQKSDAYSINEGTMTVSKSGDNYTIDIDAQADGDPLKLHYVGSLVVAAHPD